MNKQEVIDFVENSKCSKCGTKSKEVKKIYPPDGKYSTWGTNNVCKNCGNKTSSVIA